MIGILPCSGRNPHHISYAGSSQWQHQTDVCLLKRLGMVQSFSHCRSKVKQFERVITSDLSVAEGFYLQSLCKSSCGDSRGWTPTLLQILCSTDTEGKKKTTKTANRVNSVANKLSAQAVHVGLHPSVCIVSCCLMVCTMNQWTRQAIRKAQYKVK
jgi:hypothetical protein